jgi:hypothetical protein
MELFRIIFLVRSAIIVKFRVTFRVRVRIRFTGSYGGCLWIMVINCLILKEWIG